MTAQNAPAYLTLFAHTLGKVTRQSECNPSAKRGLHSLCRFGWLH